MEAKSTCYHFNRSVLNTNWWFLLTIVDIDFVDFRQVGFSTKCLIIISRYSVNSRLAKPNTAVFLTLLVPFFYTINGKFGSCFFVYRKIITLPKTSKGAPRPFFLATPTEQGRQSRVVLGSFAQSTAYGDRLTASKPKEYQMYDCRSLSVVISRVVIHGTYRPMI